MVKRWRFRTPEAIQEFCSQSDLPWNSGRERVVGGAIRLVIVLIIIIIVKLFIIHHDVLFRVTACDAILVRGTRNRDPVSFRIFLSLNDLNKLTN